MERPRASSHYPKSLGEFQSWFRTDADCLDYLDTNSTWSQRVCLRFGTSRSAQNSSRPSCCHSLHASHTAPHCRGRHRRSCDKRRRTTEASSISPAQPSSGNSASVREAPSASSTTSIEQRQDRSCTSLISPRYSTCRCSTRPWASRRCSTMLQYRCVLPSFLRVVARRNMPTHYPRRAPDENRQGLHYSGFRPVSHDPAFE